MKLHIGCFDQPVDGWINTDITPHIAIARVPLLPHILRAAGVIDARRFEQHRAGTFRKVRYLDVARRFPFSDASFEAVFSSHVLEHLFPDDASACLREILRTLRPGGVCRTAVPDLDAIVRRYSSENPQSFLQAMYETSRRSKNGHHWMYSAASLVDLLRGIGFREAYRCAYREGRCPDLERLDNRPEDSLFVEAVK